MDELKINGMGDIGDCWGCGYGGNGGWNAGGNWLGSGRGFGDSVGGGGYGEGRGYGNGWRYDAEGDVIPTESKWTN